MAGDLEGLLRTVVIGCLECISVIYVFEAAFSLDTFGTTSGIVFGRVSRPLERPSFEDARPPPPVSPVFQKRPCLVIQDAICSDPLHKGLFISHCGELVQGRAGEAILRVPAVRQATDRASPVIQAEENVWRTQYSEIVARLHVKHNFVFLSLVHHPGR